VCIEVDVVGVVEEGEIVSLVDADGWLIFQIFAVRSLLAVMTWLLLGLKTACRTQSSCWRLKRSCPVLVSQIIAVPSLLVVMTWLLLGLKSALSTPLSC